MWMWAEKYQKYGMAGLEPYSCRPKRVRKLSWSETLVEGVRSLRELYSWWRKEKIKVLLEEDEICGSVSTVGRMIADLQRGHQLTEVKYKKVWKPKRRVNRMHATRKPQGYAVEKPGDIVQLDTLNIHPFPNVHFKHFTPRDIVCRWDVLEVYPKAISRQVKAFLLSLNKRMPFPNRTIPEDGGIEFMAEFEQVCAELGIQLFLLPPRFPKLNEGVERAHRTHLDEFYAVHAPDGDLQNLNKELLKGEWV